MENTEDVKMVIDLKKEIERKLKNKVWYKDTKNNIWRNALDPSDTFTDEAYDAMQRYLNSC